MCAVLPSLINRLGSNVASEQAHVLMHLTEILDTMYGEDADALCEYLRASGGVSRICAALENEHPNVYQPAMLLVGNLASTAVDSHAEKTKKLLKESDAFKCIIEHLFDTDWTTLVYALGAMQVIRGCMIRD